MDFHFCPECGTALTVRESANDGPVPYCPLCGRTRHPLYNCAVSMIVTDSETGKILLIRQYGRPAYILVAGYINHGETAEAACARELQEETGLTAVRLHFNRTRFFAPSDTLMCNFTVWVRSADELNTNAEIDDCCWFTPEEARRAIKPGSLAAEFLNAWLNDGEA